MPFELFHSASSPAGQLAPDYSSFVPMHCDTRLQALDAACALIKAGEIVWKIEGPDGFCMTRSEVEKIHDIRRRIAKPPPR